jgi:hypothetical protein
VKPIPSTSKVKNTWSYIPTKSAVKERWSYTSTEDAKCDVLGVLETPFGLFLRFIYDFTSRHYNFFLQCALFTSVLILYLGWSSDCWLLGCCSNLTPLISSDTASLIDSFDLPLTLRL